MTAYDGLLEAGYTTVPLLDAKQVSRIRSYYDALGVDREHSRFVSSVHCDRAHAREVDLWLKAELGPIIQEIIGDYDPFFAAFISKGARHGARIDQHQDWTYTDERSARVVTAWIPLIDVDEHNGAMAVIPGSHRWIDGIRVSNAVDRDEPTTPFQDAFDDLAVSIEMGAGQALLYDPALIHGSPANPSSVLRPAAGIAFAPRGTPLVHFRRDERGTIEGFTVDRDDFYMDAHLGRPQGFEPIQAWTRPVVAEDFEPFLTTSEQPGLRPSTDSTSTDEQASESEQSPGRAISSIRDILRRRVRPSEGNTRRDG